MFMSSISRWRSGLTGASRTGWVIVRLLVEGAGCSAAPSALNAGATTGSDPYLTTRTHPAQRVRSSAPLAVGQQCAVFTSFSAIFGIPESCNLFKPRRCERFERP